MAGVQPGRFQDRPAGQTRPRLRFVTSGAPRRRRTSFISSSSSSPALLPGRPSSSAGGHAEAPPLALSVVFGNLLVLAGSFPGLARDVPSPSRSAPRRSPPSPSRGEGELVRADALHGHPADERTHALLRRDRRVDRRALPGMSEGVFCTAGGVMMRASSSPAILPRARHGCFRLAGCRRQQAARRDKSLISSATSHRARRVRRRSRNPKAPPLRIVQGGLDDDLKNRKLPKDKRYLNQRVNRVRRSSRRRLRRALLKPLPRVDVDASAPPSIEDLSAADIDAIPIARTPGTRPRGMVSEVLDPGRVAPSSTCSSRPPRAAYLLRAAGKRLGADVVNVSSGSR